MTFPPLFHAAEQVSADSQRAFFLIRGAELGALVVAAAAGLVPRSWSGPAPLIALLALVGAVGLRISGAGDKAEKRWYDARAAAESVKSAAWQYAVAGEGFRHEDVDADERFVQLLRRILGALPRIDVPATSVDAVTKEMRHLRQSDLDARRTTYIRDRVEEQLSWYSAKAKSKGQSQRRASRTMLGFEVCAVGLALWRLMEPVEIDAPSLFITAAAATGAWSQAKNFGYLSEAYSVTSHELPMVKDSLDRAQTEASFAQAVHDAEAAFSREHTMWLARQQSPR